MKDYVGKRGVLTLALLQGAQVEVLRRSTLTGYLTVRLLADYNGAYKAGAELHIAPYEFREQGAGT